MAAERVSVCQACGATIYPEHLDTGIAGYSGGQLMCPHCFAEAQKSADASGNPILTDDKDELSTIALLEEEKKASDDSSTATAMHGFSGDSFAAGADAILDESKYTRRLNPQAVAATRCRTFHAKLNAGAVAFMNDQINSWVDAHEDVVIKFASTDIGIFEGKKADPNLIVTLFY